MRPELVNGFGCGVAPSAPLPLDVDDMCSWDPKLGRLDPFARVQAGLPAYPDLGFGSILIDWECCPRWHGQLTDARMGGQLPAIFARKAATWRDKGSLRDCLGGEPTQAVIQAIELTDQLDRERDIMDQEKREAERERRKSARELSRG